MLMKSSTLIRSLLSNTIRTRTRATRKPKRSSRRLPRPTTCSATPRSVNSTTSSASIAPGGGFGGGGFGGAGFDINDIFSQFGDIFGGGFGFGGGGRRSSRKAGPPRGNDLQIKVALSYKEIFEGCTKKVRLKRYTPCTECNGKGGTNVKECSTCHGTGRVRRVSGGFFQMVSEPATAQVACVVCRADSSRWFPKAPAPLAVALER